MAKKKPHRTAPDALSSALGLPRLGVDTHAHLDFPPLAEALPQALERAAAAGVAWLGQVFLGPQAYHDRRALFEAHPQVFFILGVHPHDAAGCDDASLAAMESACRADPRLKALGEIGLDFHWNHSPPEVQRQAFARQLELARSLDLPPVIHSREAFPECVAILQDMGFAHRPVLWHCFGGDVLQARTLVSLGWTLSIPGPATYSRNAALREAVAAIPLSQLVLETDCPYLSPEPWRGQPNEPAYLVFTAAEVARCKDMPPAELWTACAATARAFFHLPEHIEE